ncbi:hypothetical protein PG997_000905 [Apiospora hydei]|uniref:Uncharacterized protein n=1 Tax=Apiospora hydei TaxID=1337664 RepID=A0ABR1XBZ3_9PEZI
MFTTLARRAIESPIPLRIRNAARASAPGIYGRFKPKKVWPPDFSKLSEKGAVPLRAEVQTTGQARDNAPEMGQIREAGAAVQCYGILFMEWNTEQQPFQEIRGKFWGAVDAFSPNKRNERRALE